MTCVMNWKTETVASTNLVTSVRELYSNSPSSIFLQGSSMVSIANGLLLRLLETLNKKTSSFDPLTSANRFAYYLFTINI
ncbi:hypothetical protein TNCV_5123291 [Trichonephila clavipes]|nr:hypothetical protein TNCV_5123291 [Trichonephila clavipes]